MSLRNLLRLVALPLLVVMLGLALNKVMKDIINTPAAPTGITPVITLRDTVDARRAHLVEGGEHTFAGQCLKLFPRAFRRAEELTGLEQSIVLGVAGYESAGCRKPKGGPGNVMHVTLPNQNHLVEAARLLEIPVGSLNWRAHSEHSAVLGAVMIRDYTTRTRSLATGLSAYRHGPDKTSYAPTGDAYTRTVLAHVLMARRIFLSQDADATFVPESSINPMEFPAAWWTVASPPEVETVALR